MPFDVAAYAQSFNLTGVAVNERVLPGSQLNLRLVTDQLVGNLEDIQVVLGDVDLDLVFRHLQLTSMVNDAPLAPWPAPTPALISDPPQQNAVEGWVGSISGKLPVGFRVIEDELIIEVIWHLTDQNGKPLAEGQDIRKILQQDQPLAVDVLFAPGFVQWSVPHDASLEAAVANANPATRYIQAEIRVRTRVAGGDSGKIRIPAQPIPVLVLPLPILDLVVAFRSVNYGSNALCLLPGNSPLADELNQIMQVLQTVRGPINALAFFSRFIGLQGVVSVLTGQLPNVGVTVEKDDSEEDMNNVIMRARTGWLDMDWEDRISSLVGLSIARHLNLFEHDKFKGKSLTVGPYNVPNNAAVLVSTLHTTNPVSEPPGALSRSGSPNGGWGDKISSYRWV
jgi:hypothetical protein